MTYKVLLHVTCNNQYKPIGVPGIINVIQYHEYRVSTKTPLFSLISPKVIVVLTKRDMI